MKFYPKVNLWLLLCLSLFAIPAFAQTITVTNFDPGPYSPGSTIAVPFHIDNSTGNCITQTNTFNLYLSDPTGTSYPSTPLATVSGFYATYINAIIPATTQVGTNYKVKVTASSNPAAIIVESPAFQITTGTAITAGISSALTIDNTHPDVFGNCNGAISNFGFQANATNATTVTANFFNESSQTSEASVIPTGSVNGVGGSGAFTPAKTNYTIIVKASDGSVNGTKAYTLINNPSNSNFGFSGTASVCLGGVLTFNIDISSPDGIQYNYPGNTYKFDWGDGTTSLLTYCDIAKLTGHVSHTYLKSSCGNIVGTVHNVFKISFEPNNPYCGSFNAVSTTAKISAQPTNVISGPISACAGVAVKFTNNSYPGEDPTSTPDNCVDFKGASYSWYLDGSTVPVASNVPKGTAYSTKLTAGTHVIRLRLDNNPTSCSISDATFTICVQDSPNPAFKVPTAVCITGTTAAVTPTLDNTFVIDNTCFINPFKWTVTGGPVSYAGGTTDASITPNFVFTIPGTYLIDLAVTDACGTIKKAVQQKVIINNAPTSTLSPDLNLCGSQTLTFNNNSGPTKVTFTGTTDLTAPGVSFLWTVTPAPGAAPATFVGGTTATSQYPRINFPGYGNYTVTVTNTNNCGTSVPVSQKINIQNAPTISAGPVFDNIICAAASTFQLNGAITDPASTVSSYKWTSTGDGTFDSPTTSKTPIYTLGPNDKNGGTIQLTLTAVTTLIGQCSNIPVSINLIITPTDKVTSVNTAITCNNTALNYALTASQPGTTYTWTATGTANASGFIQQSTPMADPATITDVLTNTSPVNNATVTYMIIPTVNGCPGTPFTLTVTVTPGPVLSPIANPSVCSGNAVNLLLNSNVAGTKYTWTSTASAGINGATTQTTPISIAAITDVLNDANAASGTVTYQITPISPAGCPGTVVMVTVTVQPLPTLPNAGPDRPICNATTYVLEGNTPTSGTGKWTQTGGPAGITFVNAANAKTTAQGLIPGQTYLFTWTISDNCNGSNSDEVQIIDNLPTVGGIAATAVNPVCYGSNGTVTLSGNVGDVSNWELSTNNGVTWQPVANTTTTLTYTNLTQTTIYRAVVRNGNCSITASQPVTVTVNPPTLTPNAGPDQLLCNQTNTTLQGNNPGTFTGTWTQTGGPTAGVIITSPNAYNTTVSGLTGGNNYTFTWTIHGIPPCADLADNVVVADQSQIINTININRNNSAYICAGNTATITGDTPTGGIGPYGYVWESSADNGATWAVLAGQTAQNASVLITVPVLIRRTVFSNQLICNVVSNTLDIVLQTAISKNSVSTTSAEICNNTIPAPIIGSAPAGGNGVYTYQWQSSMDGAIFADISGATAKDYQPAALTATTYYQRIVNSSLCGGTLNNTSNKLIIVVDPDVKASFTATLQRDCAPFSISSQVITAFNDPNAKTFTWYADGQKIGEGLSFPGYIIQTDGQTVTIKLVVSSQFGCKDDVFTMNFTTPKKVIPGFTIDKTTSCGPVTVNFTNTSVPTAGVIFTWIFGDGTTYTGTTPPAHTFQPLANGKDVTYTITLTSDGCSPSPSTQQVTVYPDKPVAEIDPGVLTGCAPYTINVANLSPGTNSSYTYYLYDNNNALVQTIIKNDKSSVQFNPVSTNTTKIYTLYMVAKNLCGVTNESVHYPITISAPITTALMNITPLSAGNIPAGCAPYMATFHNLSAGGSSYVYNVYDSNFGIIESIVNNTTDDQNYTFTKPGTYYVTIGVFSNCIAGKESAKLKVVVYPIPAPDFTASSTTDCTQLTVNFTNNTPGDINAPAVSYTYDWDFGDGTHSSDYAPTHTYDYKKSPYTVTLTATNNTGCTGIGVKTDYIIVHPPPGTDFTALPDTITAIPNYHFDFQDKTNIPPVSWFWDLGDGTTSTRQNPSHTYADTGKYVVKLTTVTQFGCTETKTHTVQITGVPGQLYVPNAFMPTSLSTELRTFTVKGSGIKNWSMRIFNNWGQMVFETNKLNSKGEPLEFWDGRFKGQDAQQGVYVWQISATFINGTEWKGMTYKGEAPKRAGTLNLIR